MIVEPECVCLSARAAVIEKSIGYQAFRSNFRLPRRVSVPFRSCLLTEGSLNFRYFSSRSTVRAGYVRSFVVKQLWWGDLGEVKGVGYRAEPVTITLRPRFEWLPSGTR